MKKLKLITIILLALMLAIVPLLGACGGVTPGEEEEEEGGPEYGGVLKIISGSAVQSFGYPMSQMFTSYDAFYCTPAVESLMRTTLDGGFEPFLALNWTISPDLKSLTLTLRQGVKFHDGTDFNAQAVKSNLDLYQAMPGPRFQSISSVEVLDDYSVRVNLSQVDPFILEYVGTAALIISPTALATHGKDWCATHPVGTGPFKFLSFQRDASIKYERFDGYWQEGKPYLDGVEYVLISEPVTASIAFQAGEAYALMLSGPRDAADLQETGKFNIVHRPSMTVGWTSDSANPNSPFADIRVRQAVEYAIDKQSIVEAIGYGFLEVTNQPVPSGHPCYNPNVVGYTYDPEKARELLAETDYANGFETKLIYPAGFPEVESAFTAVVSYLAAVGIECELMPVSSVIYITQYVTGKGNFENGLVYMAVSADPLTETAVGFKAIFSKNGIAFLSVAYPDDYEDTLSEAVSDPEYNNRIALNKELMRLIVDEYCLYTGIFVNSSFCALWPTVHDHGILEASSSQWTPENAWISGTKPGWEGGGTTPPPAAAVDWSDVPIYTGAVLVQDTVKPAPFPGGPTYSKTETKYYETADAWDVVKAFYAAELPNQGWQIGGMGDWMDESIASMAGVPTMKALAVFTKGGDAEGLTVMVYLANNMTRIMLEKSEK